MLFTQGETYLPPPRSRFESTVGAILRFFCIVLSVIFLIGLAAA